MCRRSTITVKNMQLLARARTSAKNNAQNTTLRFCTAFAFIWNPFYSRSICIGIQYSRRFIILLNLSVETEVCLYLQFEALIVWQ